MHLLEVPLDGAIKDWNLVCSNHSANLYKCWGSNSENIVY